MSETRPRPALQQRVAEAILEGAARIFVSQGEQASMNAVAEAAGVARATLYRYFPNREALLEELAQAALADLDTRLASARIDEVAPEEGIKRAVRTAVELGDSFVLLAQERLRGRIGGLRTEAHRAAPAAVRARPGRRRGARGRRQPADHRGAHRLDRRRADLEPPHGAGGHDRHDHRPVPRWRSRARPATDMSSRGSAEEMAARSSNAPDEEETMDEEREPSTGDEETGRKASSPSTMRPRPCWRSSSPTCGRTARSSARSGLAGSARRSCSG